MPKPKKLTKRLFGSPARLARSFGLLLAALLAVPLLLVPVYGFVVPVSVPMLIRYATGQAVTRHWRPLDSVSDRLKAAVVLSEDGQFCRHWGVDAAALRVEIEDFVAGRPARGASTITMQLARNLFLGNDRNVVRKALEIPLAAYIDLVLPKRRILELYLNIAEWGPDGEFGAEAGAQAAFGIDADAMSWRQASLLAVSLTNPHLRQAGQPSARMGRLAGIVERRARTGTGHVGCLYKSGQFDANSL